MTKYKASWELRVTIDYMCEKNGGRNGTVDVAVFRILSFCLDMDWV